jgi:hypothetical protein
MKIDQRAVHEFVKRVDECRACERGRSCQSTIDFVQIAR